MIQDRTLDAPLRPAKPAEPTLEGRAVAQYRVERFIGSGGMGQVHLATDGVLGRQVALKTLSTRHGGDSGAVDRFFREAVIQSRIAHPNVVGIYAAGSDGPVHFIAMEYVEGEDIDRTIKSHGRLPTRSILEIAHQAADGLAAAHDLGILHRDLKPHNMLMDYLGRVKILDFGIARDLSTDQARLTKVGQVLGTPAYMSPEQCAGEELDARSDVFSLGVVMYLLIAGKLPHPGRTPHEVLHSIVSSPPPPLSKARPDTPPRLERIVRKAIAAHPGERYPTARHLEADLRLCRLEDDLDMLMH